MRKMPLERDINIAINSRSWRRFTTKDGPFMAMLISCSGGTYLIDVRSAADERNVRFAAAQGDSVVEIPKDIPLHHILYLITNTVSFSNGHWSVV